MEITLYPGTIFHAFKNSPSEITLYPRQTPLRCTSQLNVVHTSNISRNTGKRDLSSKFSQDDVKIYINIFPFITGLYVFTCLSKIVPVTFYFI